MAEKKFYPIASLPWSTEDEDRLRSFVLAGKNAAFFSKALMRSEAAVLGRAYKLGLFFW